jgi:hypothetical protein
MPVTTRSQSKNNKIINNDYQNNKLLNGNLIPLNAKGYPSVGHLTIKKFTKK